MSDKTKAAQADAVTITPLNMAAVEVRIVGASPYMQAKFSGKARQAMVAKQTAGSTSAKGVKRAPRDFDADFQGAMHRAAEGWIGIPASAFRNACIDACRVAGFQMTRAKMSIFFEAHGFDGDDGTPLVRLDAAEPERTEMAVRNETGVVDIRVRPMWRTWAVNLRLVFDADQFTAADALNLLTRAGAQVGIGEGRPFSKKSAGMGFGLFAVESANEPVAAS
jgi:hypothetical protein